MKKITLLFMLTFFLSLLNFLVITTLIYSGIADRLASKHLLLGLYGATIYLLPLSFLLYTILRFKENAERFNELLVQREKVTGLIAVLKSERQKGNVTEGDFDKYLSDYTQLLEGINRALSLRNSRIKGLVSKQSVTFLDKMKFSIVNFFSTKKVRLAEQPAKKEPDSIIGEVYKFTLLLEPYKKLYSQEEIKQALVEEKCSEAVASKVIEVLYSV